MLLSQLFSPKKIIAEGGNLTSNSPGWQGMPGEHEAEEIDLKLHDRDFMVGQIRVLLQAQNESFQAAYGRPIWDPKLLDSNQMFSGSSLQFFDVKGVSTQDFLNKLKKTKVGDIDTQVDQAIGDDVTAWLKSVVGKQVGNGTFVGFNSSLSALWQLQDPPVKIQVDYELGPYEPAKGKEPARPTEWFAYSHSSDLADMEAGIKGVFHKYINRALTHASATTKYVARVLKKGVKISPEPVTDSDYSFAVSSSQGGGLATKYKPYVDPQTGQPMEIDGIPVMQLLDTGSRDYVQNLDQQFQTMYSKKRSAADKKLQNSFVGTMQLMNQNFKPEQNDAVARSFLEILFGKGAQMLTAGDPVRDRDTKFAALDFMFENLKLPDAQGLRQEAVQMAMDYEAAYKAKGKPVAENFADGKHPEDKGDSKRHGVPTKASVSTLRKVAKQGGRKGQLAHWMANMKAGRAKNESIYEAEVQAQLRKGMPHLRALKPLDLIDLLEEIHDGNGNFKLENMPLNVKVDGFGGRFGKDSAGKPFMGTSNTPPRYEASFVKYHQQKGTTDADILGRAQLFDNLFNEMMAAIDVIDQNLGPDFLIDKQVTCEVLFLPFATETPEGKLKFVGIHYDKLPDGVQLALVPFRVVTATTGEELPDASEFVKEITSLGQQGSTMFIDNSLKQLEALDVTGLVPPMENLATFKEIMTSNGKGTLELKRQVKAALEPVALALEKAIIEDPNIVGKDLLGQDYEGIVLNTRLGPVKVTSSEQRKVIADKQAAKAAARVEQPRNDNKTAVVAIGSFVGHKGHQELFNYTIDTAKELGGDPYLFMGNAVGQDDPIPVEDKIKTWQQLYPQYSKNISATMSGGSLMQKIKHELINPLPGKAPRYDSIVIMVGEDQANMPIAGALMKAVNKFPGYEHVKVELKVTPRGTGMSFTKLRNIVKTGTPDQQFQMWNDAFNGGSFGAKQLPPEWINHLIDVTRQGMGIQMPQQQPAAQEPVKQPVPERLLNALIMPQLNELDEKPKRSWADYGMTDAPVLKPQPKEKQYHGWSEYEKQQQQKKQEVPTKEGEGDPEGVEHLTKELLQHIVQQVGTEGAHAIVKSLTWGDGAAKELLHLIVQDLKNDISMAESVKQRLDPHCWKNKHKEGTKIKGGVRVNNCVANEGDVVAFPKKHRGDLSDTHDCPKCGGDLQGGKYMGHEVKVCMPCKQVYLPPNSGIDQQGNKIAEGDNERKQNALWAQITAHEKAAKASKDLKRQHHLKMADQLRSQLQTTDEDISRRGFLKGAGAVAAGMAAGDAKSIAGAFPSPSTREKWAKDAAASNAAEAKRLAAKQAKADAERLAVNTPDVDRLNKVNYHGKNAPTPSNASWDGDSDFLDLDGTQYSMASRMPISGDEPSDMKLISTKQGRQVYIWTRRSLKGTHGRYFYPAANPNTIQQEARQSNQSKLQKAWEREQEKSAAASKRGREYMNSLKEPKKDEKKESLDTKHVPVNESIESYIANAIKLLGSK